MSTALYKALPDGNYVAYDPRAGTYLVVGAEHVPPLTRLRLSQPAAPPPGPKGDGGRKARALLLMAMLEFQRRAHRVGMPDAAQPYLDHLAKLAADPTAARKSIRLSWRAEPYADGRQHRWAFKAVGEGPDAGRVLYGADAQRAIDRQQQRGTQAQEMDKQAAPVTGKQPAAGDHPEQGYSHKDFQAKKAAAYKAASKVASLASTREDITADHLKEMAGHLPYLTVAQLRSVRARLNTAFDVSFGGKSRRAAMVESVMGHVRKELDRMDAAAGNPVVDAPKVAAEPTPEPAAAKAAGPGAPALEGSESVPPHILDRVKDRLSLMKERAASLARARDLDKKFGGEGRYESEVAEGHEKQPLSDLLGKFREMAGKNGIDAERVIAEHGGEPDLSISGEAKSWRADVEARRQEKAGQQPAAPIAEPAAGPHAAARDLFDRGNGLVELKALRGTFPHLSDEQFAAGVEKLADGGKVVVSKDDSEARLEADGAPKLSNGQRYRAVTARGKITPADLAAAFPPGTPAKPTSESPKLAAADDGKIELDDDYAAAQKAALHETPAGSFVTPEQTDGQQVAADRHKATPTAHETPAAAPAPAKPPTPKANDYRAALAGDDSPAAETKPTGSLADAVKAGDWKAVADRVRTGKDKDELVAAVRQHHGEDAAKAMLRLPPGKAAAWAAENLKGEAASQSQEQPPAAAPPVTPASPEPQADPPPDAAAQDATAVSPEAPKPARPPAPTDSTAVAVEAANAYRALPPSQGSPPIPSRRAVADLLGRAEKAVKPHVRRLGEVVEKHVKESGESPRVAENSAAPVVSPAPPGDNPTATGADHASASTAVPSAGADRPGPVPQPVGGGTDGGGAGRDAGGAGATATRPRVVTARAGHTPAGSPELVPASVRPHLNEAQQQGAALAIDAMTKHGGFLLADGTGVGKTRQILAVGKHFLDQGKKVVVVSPAEVIKPDWGKGTMTGSFAADSAAMGVPTKLVKGDAGFTPGSVHVTTYNELGKLKDKIDKDTVVLFDESHALKNRTSARYKHGKEAIDKAAAVMYATATPGDKPLHVAYLARAGVFGTAGTTNTYEKLGMQLHDQHVGGGQYQKVWRVNPAVGHQEVARRLSGLFDQMTRDGLMVKRELAMDGVNVGLDHVPLTREQHDEIDKVYKDALAKTDGNKAVALMAARLHQEPMKIPATVGMVREELAAGRSPVVFVGRVNDIDAEDEGGDDDAKDTLAATGHPSEGTAKALKAALIAAGVPAADIGELHGGATTTAAQKKKAMDSFQANKTKVIIATVQSGGTGINLDDTTGTRPRTVVMVTPPFTANDMAQAIGRVHRLNTKSAARVRGVLADTEIDRWNANLLTQKFRTLGAIAGGEATRGAAAVGQDAEPGDQPPFEWGESLHDTRHYADTPFGHNDVIAKFGGKRVNRGTRDTPAWTTAFPSRAKYDEYRTAHATPPPATPAAPAPGGVATRQVQTGQGPRHVYSFAPGKEYWDKVHKGRPSYVSVRKNPQTGAWEGSVWGATPDEVNRNVGELRKQGVRLSLTTASRVLL